MYKWGYAVKEMKVLRHDMCGSAGGPRWAAPQKGVKPRGESSRNMKWFHFARMYEKGLSFAISWSGDYLPIGFLNVRQSVNAFGKSHIHRPSLVSFPTQMRIKFSSAAQYTYPIRRLSWKSKNNVLGPHFLFLIVTLTCFLCRKITVAETCSKNFLLPTVQRTHSTLLGLEHAYLALKQRHSSIQYFHIVEYR